MSLLQDSVSGLCDSQERSLHIKVLEFITIHLGLHHFTEVVRDSIVAVFSDNNTALANLNREGDTHSTLFNKEAREILDLVEAHSARILTQFVRGSVNIVVDCLSRRHQVLSAEWTLHKDVWH